MFTPEVTYVFAHLFITVCVIRSMLVLIDMWNIRYFMGRPPKKFKYGVISYFIFLTIIAGHEIYIFLSLLR